MCWESPSCEGARAGDIIANANRPRIMRVAFATRDNQLGSLVAHLSAYVDQAVRGLAGSTIKGAAFAQGMLYRELQHGARMHRAVIEGYECGNCGAVREDGTCATHGLIVASTHTKRVPIVNRLVVPVTAGGSYVTCQRLVCGSPDCGSLYPLRTDQRCPRCDWMPPPGTRAHSKQVWIRSPRAPWVGTTEE